MHWVGSCIELWLKQKWGQNSASLRFGCHPGRIFVRNSGEGLNILNLTTILHNILDQAGLFEKIFPSTWQAGEEQRRLQNQGAGHWMLDQDVEHEMVPNKVSFVVFRNGAHASLQAWLVCERPGLYKGGKSSQRFSLKSSWAKALSPCQLRFTGDTDREAARE